MKPIEDIKLHMTPEQLAQTAEPNAWANKDLPYMRFPLGSDPLQMTGHFHQVMGLPAPEMPIIPSVGMRERRLKLMVEEFLELVEACGFQLVHVGESNGGHAPDKVALMHIEGSRYDPVETLDALADLNVVVNGTAVEFGLPLHFANYEVYCANLSQNVKPNIARVLVAWQNKEFES